MTVIQLKLILKIGEQGKEKKEEKIKMTRKLRNVGNVWDVIEQKIVEDVKFVPEETSMVL